MARRSLLGCAALALVIAAPALAATTPPGVNIRWDHCYDDGGSLNKAFACDTNLGSEQLVLSFALGADKPDVTGMEIVVDVTTTGPALPSWWLFRNVGSCRQSSLTIQIVPPAGSVNCQDWSNGQSAGGIGAYTLGWAGPNTARILAATAVPIGSAATLSADNEYFIAQFTINNAKTIGTGSCAGCAEPVCIVFSSLNVTTPDVNTDQKLSVGANGTNSQFVHWQGASVQGLQLICPSPFRPCSLVYNCVLASTPTRNSTWGTVKSLYR